jgi:hypothetical protein
MWGGQSWLQAGFDPAFQGTPQKLAPQRKAVAVFLTLIDEATAPCGASPEPHKPAGKRARRHECPPHVGYTRFRENLQCDICAFYLRPQL